MGLYQPIYAVYAATKAAFETMTYVMPKELRGGNITVNTINYYAFLTHLHNILHRTSRLRSTTNLDGAVRRMTA